MMAHFLVDWWARQDYSFPARSKRHLANSPIFLNGVLRRPGSNGYPDLAAPASPASENGSLTNDERVRFNMATRFLNQRVYFIQSGDDGPIKIGIADDPVTRLRHIQTGSPERLTLLGTLHGGQDREKVLHAYLAAFRHRGEWFKPCAEVLAVVPGLAIERLQKALGDVSRAEAESYKLAAIIAFRRAGSDVLRPFAKNSPAHMSAQSL